MTKSLHIFLGNYAMALIQNKSVEVVGCVSAVSRDLWVGQKQLHIWSHRSSFSYSVQTNDNNTITRKV